MSEQLFLTELEKAERKAGIFLWPAFLTPEECDDAFQVLNNDFPWDLKPKLFGEKLTQHAYSYKRNLTADSPHKGLAYLENLCQKIEKRFDGEVADVFCNRFQDPNHRIGWHSDTYGSHIFVLTLGSERDIQFRPKKRLFSIKQKDTAIETVRPAVGDLYFMPLQLNKTHDHRVCSTMEEQAAPRLSFVFFFDPPEYARDFKITAGDRVRGFFESLLE